MDDRELLARPSPDIEHEVTRIADEFRAGFERVALIDRPAVAMFGSARVGQEHHQVNIDSLKGRVKWIQQQQN